MYTVEGLIKALENASREDLNLINSDLQAIHKALELIHVPPLNVSVCLINRLLDLLSKQEQSNGVD